MRPAKILIGIALFSVFAISSSFTSSNNKPGAWFLLGDKSVGFGVDHDVIYFGNWKDDVRQLQLRVTDGPLKMYDMKIYFDNGSVQDVALRSRFAQGSSSRVIDLDGGLRHLSKIEFTYETKGFIHGHAKLQVWGKL
jgi:hypothetical protein